MKIDLSPIATKELIQELNRRTTLMQSNGLLSPDAFRLRAKLGAIVCTDGVPIRMHEGVLQAGLIRRNTGDYQGKLCLIGGVVALGETLDTALRRHFRTDIGKEISFLDSRGACCPCAAYQYYGDGRSNDFLPEPTKHAVALTYLVSISDGDFVFGSSEFGQEASAFEWYSTETCPPAEEFGYSTRGIFLECLSAASTFLQEKNIPS